MDGEINFQIYTKQNIQVTKQWVEGKDTELNSFMNPPPLNVIS
jgi:hypothetical protein